MRNSLAIPALALSLIAGQASADNPVNVKSSPVAPSSWKIDPSHSRIAFSVAHMVVSEVDGQFNDYSASVLLDDTDLTKSQLEFKAEVVSIDTHNADRDKHLKSGDFFDAEHFPQLTFKSTHVQKVGAAYKITGNLTLRGVTKPVTLEATLSEPVASPFGSTIRAARVKGSLSRRDFGVSWNKAMDKGGVVVGDRVEIDIKLELNK
jgi:polyisoprenoid-binding protein YceI